MFSALLRCITIIITVIVILFILKPRLIYDIQIFKIIKLLTIHPPGAIIARAGGKGGHIKRK
jgi:hypothetical protein